jgi:hypothetical protein
VGQGAQGAESQPCRDLCPRGGRSSPETRICFFGSANGDEWFRGYVERASTVNGWERTKMGRDEVQGGARYFWSDVLMGAEATPRHVYCPGLLSERCAEPCEPCVPCLRQPPTIQQPPSHSPRPLSACLHPLQPQSSTKASHHISPGGEYSYPHQSVPSAKAFSSPFDPHPRSQATSIKS